MQRSAAGGGQDLHGLADSWAAIPSCRTFLCTRSMPMLGHPALPATGKVRSGKMYCTG